MVTSLINQFKAGDNNKLNQTAAGSIYVGTTSLGF